MPTASVQRSRTTSLTSYPGYDSKLLLLVKLQFWSFVEWGVLLHCHYSQVHSDPGVVVPVRVLSMSQIELFNHLFYLKPFNCVQTVNSNT